MQVQSAVVRRTSERKTPNMTKNMLTSHYDIMDDVARKFPEGAQARMESSRESHQMAIVSGIPQQLVVVLPWPRESAMDVRDRRSAVRRIVYRAFVSFLKIRAGWSRRAMKIRLSRFYKGSEAQKQD
jgi:hypothetical protein